MDHEREAMRDASVEQAPERGVAGRPPWSSRQDWNFSEIGKRTGTG